MSVDVEFALHEETPSPDEGYRIGARGPLSEGLLAFVRASAVEGRSWTANLPDIARATIAAAPEVTRSDDLQLSLFVLYGLAYRTLHTDSLVDEWDLILVEVRQEIERAFEAELRGSVPIPQTSLSAEQDMAEILFSMTAPSPRPSVSRYLASNGSRVEFVEFLMHRSIYQLREADPHSWAIPRLTGGPKAALVEIQADEYGGGRPDRVHAELFAQTMRGAGLSDAYGHYVNTVPALTLASHNAMSLFGLNGRLLGAIVGHLAAFEMTSTTASARYAKAARRLGFGEDVAAYFDEHVEADAVHEQVAAHDLAGALAKQQPHLASDIVFGASTLLHLEDLSQTQWLEAWERGDSSLLPTILEGRAA